MIVITPAHVYKPFCLSKIDNYFFLNFHFSGWTSGFRFILHPCASNLIPVTKYIYHELRFINMDVTAENIEMKLDEVLRRLDHVETLIVMGEVFPDDEELKAIRDYFIREKKGETDFISLQEIDNEL